MGSHKKKSSKEKDSRRNKKDKKHKKSKKRKRHPSSSSSPSSSKMSESQRNALTGSSRTEEEYSYEVPLPPRFSTSGKEQPQQIRRPVTKEQYEARSKQIRKVLDPVTGRHRLIRGEGEIIEEVVSKERHKQINQQATHGDGESFQRTLHTLLK